MKSYGLGSRKRLEPKMKICPRERNKATQKKKETSSKNVSVRWMDGKLPIGSVVLGLSIHVGGGGDDKRHGPDDESRRRARAIEQEQ
jgi:hypothetical protein